MSNAQADLGRPDWDGVRQRLRGRLVAAGLSQRRFALAVGVSHQTVTNWLTDGSISSQRLPAVAQALDLTVEELLTGSSPPPVAPDEDLLRIARALARLGPELEPLQRAVPDLIGVLEAAQRYLEEG